MLSFLPGPIVGVIAALGVVLNTLFWAVPIYSVALIKLFVPHKGFRLRCTDVMTRMAEAWIQCNHVNMALTQPTRWDIDLPPGLRRDGSYLVISNHVSSVDIPALQRALNLRIPFQRYFLKQQLLYLPVLGLAWWALDFPYMRRYSKQQREARPELRSHDLENARRACKKLQDRPVALLSFLEGTRFTPEKKERFGSPFRNLLAPRAGGVGMVLACLGDRLDGILDVTLRYSEPRVGFWNYLCGKVRWISIRATLLDVPRQFVGGDYLNDAEFRQQFQAWLNELWRAKDAQIDELRALGGQHAFDPVS